jgi:lipopolysaccharide assembly protein A
VKLVHWLVTLPVAIVAVLFAISNLDPVPVGLWPFAAIDLPLYLVVLAALALGFLAGQLVAWINGRHWRRAARKRQRRIEALEREAKAPAAGLPAASGRRD